MSRRITLVTSRAPLHLTGEQECPVLPLPVPDLERLPAPEALRQYPAVELFVQRVQVVQPAFQVTAANARMVAEICRRLDGVPLALLLAAVWCKLLTPAAVLSRLDQRFTLLTGGARDLPARQQTLRATIDWSYNLLQPDEQLLFARLACFSGTWSVEAVVAVCALGDDASDSVMPTLRALVEKSLVHQSGTYDEQLRFTMLETIREYAQERLAASDDYAAVRHLHADYYCKIVELYGPALETANVATALHVLDRDYDNIRGALLWSFSAGRLERCARMIAALSMFWEIRGLLSEGRLWQAQILDLRTIVPQPLRSRICAQAAQLAYRSGRFNEVTDLADSVLADPDAAVDDHATATKTKGLAAIGMGDLVLAQSYFKHAIAVAQVHGLPSHVATAQGNLSLCLMLQGQIADAETVASAAYAAYDRLGHWRGKGITLTLLGAAAMLRGDLANATPSLHAGMQMLAGFGETLYLLHGLLAMSTVATLEQQPRRAVRLFSAATHQAEILGVSLPPPVIATIQPLVDRACNQLGHEGYTDAWNDGWSLGIDEAVFLAYVDAQ